MGDVIVHLTVRAGPHGSNPLATSAQQYASKARHQPSAMLLARIGEAIHNAALLAGDGIVTEVRAIVGPAELIDPRQ